MESGPVLGLLDWGDYIFRLGRFIIKIHHIYMTYHYLTDCLERHKKNHPQNHSPFPKPPEPHTDGNYLTYLTKRYTSTKIVPFGKQTVTFFLEGVRGNLQTVTLAPQHVFMPPCIIIKQMCIKS